MAGSEYWSKAPRAAAIVAAAAIAAFGGVWLRVPAAERWVGLSALAAPVDPKALERPVASAAMLEQLGDRTRLTFELSQTVEVAPFVLADPDRAVIDLPQTDFALDPETGKAASAKGSKKSLVAAFRFGQLEPGKSRIVIDLDGPAKILRAGCERGETDGRARLIVELAKTDPASFQRAVQAAKLQLAEARAADQPQKPQPAPAKPVIVLDPGHGGIDRGAMVKGVVEKEVVLEFARGVAAKLEAGGRFAVVMTRSDDRFISLSERVRKGRDSNAALFVSIHADTLSEAADVSGATVYTLSSRASDSEAARVAERENQSDAAAGLDATEDASEISDILFDLTRRETRAYSHLFARTLTDHWRIAGRLNKNPRRSARFLVLKAPDVPSVLLELGYLSNKNDAQALSSPQWREKAADQVAEAIEAFLASRTSNEAVTKADSDSASYGKSRVP